jgi:hypothetical protein
MAEMHSLEGERLKREQRSEIRRGQLVKCIRKEGTRQRDGRGQ